MFIKFNKWLIKLIKLISWLIKLIKWLIKNMINLVWFGLLWFDLLLFGKLVPNQTKPFLSSLETIPGRVRSGWTTGTVIIQLTQASWSWKLVWAWLGKIVEELFLTKNKCKKIACFLLVSAYLWAFFSYRY